ncbi:MAG: hypothetical protein M1561_05260 [Gammaproteobacteria bacterium]|nr:hypothetical protein [Gammaproteobacteria bacterium]
MNNQYYYNNTIHSFVMPYMGKKTILVWDRESLKSIHSLPFIDFIKNKNNGIQQMVVASCNYNISTAKFLEDYSNANDNLYNILDEKIVESIKSQISQTTSTEAKEKVSTKANRTTNLPLAKSFLKQLAAIKTLITKPLSKPKLTKSPDNGVVVVGVQVPGCSLGDYSHMHDIFHLLLDKFPQSKMHVFIGIDYQHPNRHLLYEKIKHDFYDRNIECVVYTIFYKDEIGTYLPNQEVIAYVEKLLTADDFIGAFSISYPCKEVSIACANQQKIETRIFAHAIQKANDQFPVININMGMDDGRFGVKLPKVVAEDHLYARANILVRIAQSEPRFFKLLTGRDFSTTNSSANLAAAKLYLESHHYNYGFIQGNNDLLLFIVSHVLKYLTHNTLDKPCDFHIPKITDELKKLIQDELKKYGIDENAIEFLSKENLGCANMDDQIPYTSPCKIRIFTYKIKNDEVWKLLYQISKDGVGASGDNSAEQAYCSRSVPFIITIQDDRRCWVMSLRKIAESLQLGTEILNYFDLLIKYANKTRRYNAEVTFENDSITISEVTQEFAKFLRDPNLQKDWECLHKAVISNAKNNFYINFGLFLDAINSCSTHSNYIAAKTRVLNRDSNLASI